MVRYLDVILLVMGVQRLKGLKHRNVGHDCVSFQIKMMSL